MTIEQTKQERLYIEKRINELISKIGSIPIANNKIMPFGWRKAAKGRTVWRIVEEVISQNLEKHQKDLGFDSIKAAESEIGVFDFEFVLTDNTKSFVNVKSSVLGGKPNKDDISKGVGLINFYSENPESNLYIATFVIDFTADMHINLVECIVMPVAWIPDIYINPSNNGNLQSYNYKNLSKAVYRTNSDFFSLLKAEMEVANKKKEKKNS